MLNLAYKSLPLKRAAVVITGILLVLHGCSGNGEEQPEVQAETGMIKPMSQSQLNPVLTVVPPGYVLVPAPQWGNGMGRSQPGWAPPSTQAVAPRTNTRATNPWQAPAQNQVATQVRPQTSQSNMQGGWGMGFNTQSSQPVGPRFRPLEGSENSTSGQGVTLVAPYDRPLGSSHSVQRPTWPGYYPPAYPGYGGAYPGTYPGTYPGGW